MMADCLPRVIPLVALAGWLKKKKRRGQSGDLSWRTDPRTFAYNAARRWLAAYSTTTSMTEVIVPLTFLTQLTMDMDLDLYATADVLAIRSFSVHIIRSGSPHLHMHPRKSNRKEEACPTFPANQLSK
jgi:hypothetical protein